MIADSFAEVPHQQLNVHELPAARETVSEIAGRVLGHSASEVCIWYEDVVKLDDLLRQYVGGTGYDFESQSKLVVGRPFAGDSATLNYELDLWFRWIAWQCRRDRAAVVLHGPGRRRVYEALCAFGTFYPVLIETMAFLVDGQSAKVSKQTLDLVVGPGCGRRFSGWLETVTRSSTLQDVIM